MIRYGIVGLTHGMQHVKAVQRLSAARIEAVCDRDVQRLRTVQQQHELRDAQCFTDVARMLADAPVDAVVVAVPPHVQRQVALPVIEAGKHLLMEKTIAHDLTDAQAIVDAAERAATVTQVGYCVRSSPLVDLCRQIIDAGQIGRVVMGWYHMFLPYDAEADTWRAARDAGGGKLFDCACHYYDMLCDLVGESRFHRVAAFGGPAGHLGANPDQPNKLATTMVELRNGVRLTLELSELTDAPHHGKFGIVGTRGKFEANPSDAGSIKVYGHNGLFDGDLRINPNMTSGGHLGFVEQHERFISSIEHGAPVVCTPRDAMDNLRLVLAVDESISTGRIVTPDDTGRTQAANHTNAAAPDAQDTRAASPTH